MTIDQLRDAIRFHAHLYYNLDRPWLSDVAYDDMMEKLKRLEKEIPEHLIPMDSPTQLVGGYISRPLRDRR